MKVVLKWKPLERRPLGRPKQRWVDKVKKTLEEFGIQDIEAVAQDRTGRSKFVLSKTLSVKSADGQDELDKL
ncbi:Uncharacterized protein FWK35_00007076 [Aphis craccivora]|uniref:Uncharacterized protein n=1 Tax=Aphis craccivora TaxID=307492 RepID=A0A6G0Z4Y7_APHCR|nr:Uncharacterized protein FWK35_00007076 [Aphis craccivora]